MCHSCKLFLLFVWMITLIAGTACAQTEGPTKGWPRSYESGGNKVIVYQPQLDEWQDYGLLLGKAAVAVELKGKAQEYYGAIDLQATTEVDFGSRTVLLEKLAVTKLTFPNIDETLADKCRKAVKNSLPVGKTMTISLDRILAGLERTAEQAKAVALNFEPPPIYSSETPAALVMFMGEPKLKAVPGVPELLTAVNTNWDILLDIGTSKYYLLHGQSWMVTTNLLKGPWQAATSLPKSFLKLPDDKNWKVVKQNIPGFLPAEVPKVLVSLKPAELILTEGAANYSPIEGTRLLYVSNTESDIFIHSGSGQIYFLTAGRWFSAKSLSGPWSAASAKLPTDFAKIPTDHKKAHVLSSIPGTPEADAAVLLASVPRKATVDRKSTTLRVVYEGDPEFVVVNGTSSAVYYAVNSPYSVFRVENRYYSVHNGIWFVASSPTGTWVVCASVPLVIYTIPSTHPKHNVTYVRVYDSTPDTIVVGYTSGYSGTYVATTGVVMFGLGYWMAYDDPYYHYHHYHYHSHYYAYGSGAHYDYYHGGYYHSARYYGPHGGAAGWSGYDPGSGTYYRGGYVSGPYGNAFAREAYNPYTNRYAAQAGGKTPYGSWGRTVVQDGNDWARAGHRSKGGKIVGAIETSKGGKAIGGYNKWTGRGAVVGKDKYGDVYVGRDGNVYKREGETWQKNSGKGWSDVDTAADRNSAQSRADSARSRAGISERTRSVTSNINSQRTRSGSSGSSRLSSGRSRYSSQGSYSQRRSNNLNREYKKRSRGNSRANNFQKRSRSTRQRSSGGGGRSRRR